MIKNIQKGDVLTEYSHDNVVRTENGKKKLCFDCSGFVYYYFLQMAKYEALAEIKNYISLKKGLPLELQEKIFAAEYIDFIQNSKKKKFWKVLSPEELKQGDLIVYALLGEQARSKHCMLVDNVLEINKSQIVLSVIDSSKHRHANDTRRAGEKGIGRGEVIIYKNEQNKWNRFRWKENIYERSLFFIRTRD